MVPLLLASALELAASRDEGAVAVRDGRRSVTYGELDAYSSALAFALARRGVAAGDRVATFLDGVPEIVAFWAIAKASAVGVPLDSEDADELAETLRELDAKALLVDAELAPTFHHAVARLPGLRAVIVRGRRADAEATGSAAYVSYETALAEEDPLSRPPPGRIDLDDAWLEPDEDGERVALSHHVLLARGASLALGLDVKPEDVLSGAPLAEIATACALARAAVAVGDEVPVGAARSLWVGEEEDEPDDEATPFFVQRSTRSGPVALLADGNEPSRVLPNVDVRIVDDHGAPVAAKVVGEIAVRSSAVAGSAAGGTAQTATPGAYFRTGAAGMLDDAGALYVL